jgi:hypothetical protein
MFSCIFIAAAASATEFLCEMVHVRHYIVRDVGRDAATEAMKENR